MFNFFKSLKNSSNVCTVPFYLFERGFELKIEYLKKEFFGLNYF